MMDGRQGETLSGINKDRLRQAAEILIEARRTLQPIDGLPPDLRPQNLEEAYYIQDVLTEMLGGAGGWKVGAPAPDATPLYCPMPALGIASSEEVVSRHFRRLRGVEAEIAFQLGKDLPPRPAAYTRDELIEAIASCHPAIELLESALLDPETADRWTVIADLQSNGGFLSGPAIANWQACDFGAHIAQMRVDGFVRVEDGRNAAGGDLLRLVLWLANEAQPRTGGLRAGQWITTGSWTGKILADSGSVVLARFPGLGEVAARFD